MKWHRTTDVHNSPLICENDGPYCYFYDNGENKLVISEQGKHFEDHAVAVFKVADIKDAESIIKKLVKFGTL